jgi:Reverse transcriptase (RNA-dependent DNA polymerase)
VFNQEVRLDLMYIDGRPVLYVVDTGTVFGVATFLDEQSFGSVWNALLRCWSTMYVGFPMSMLTGQGSIFLSRDWKASCAALGILLWQTGTESHNCLGTGERFHAPLRRIYNTVSLDHPLVPPDVRLAMTVHAMNTTQGPEGLVPITLVFGKVPVIPHDDQVPVAQAPRLRAIHTAKAVGDEREALFDDAKRAGLLSLIDRGTFRLLVKDDPVDKPNVVPSRFVPAIKTKDGKDVLKARFVLGGHRDRDKNKLVHSTTFKQSSVRLALASVAIMGFDVISADVIQAYLQSARDLKRKVFVKPSCIDLDPDELLQIMKPLYGLADSGDYWAQTVVHHHLADLRMTQATGDF